MKEIEPFILWALLGLNLISLVVLIKVARQGASGRRRSGERAVMLDTCALIDGRIVEIARSGFVPSQMLVPRTVIHELQTLADQADSHRRERARFGLDVVSRLQDIAGVQLSIINVGRGDSKKPVDLQLIELAKKRKAVLYTTDYNLNKVAQVEGVKVLNVNELAQALRVSRLPGEKVSIKLIQSGQEKHQAVGYLDDGTMVVVEQASQLLGRTVDAVITRVLQTQAGKMMFAALSSSPTQQQSQAAQQRPAQTAVTGGQRPMKKPAPINPPASASVSQQKTHLPLAGSGGPKQPLAARMRRPQFRKPAQQASPEDKLLARVNQQR